MAPRTADAVVIGGGIMGLASAYHLAGAGLRVAVVERDTIGGHQSRRAWGFVRQTGRDPAEVPLMMACLRLWPGLGAELGADLLWRQEGCVFAAATEGEQAANEAWMQTAREHQIPSRLLSPRELGELIPGLSETGRGGIYTAEDGQAEPAAVAPAFARAARARGVTMLEGCGALRIETEAGRVTGVLTEAGPIRADVVVVAAGGSTARLLDHLGLRLPQQLVRGTVCRTTAAPPITGIAFAGLGLGFRQRLDGSFNIADDVDTDVVLTPGHLRALSLFVPGLRLHWRRFGFSLGRPFVDEALGLLWPRSDVRRLHGVRRPKAEPSRRRERRSLRRLRELLPAARDVRVAESWAGQIDATPDALPVIDALASPRGLIVAAGFSGHGFALGPIVGQIVAKLAAGGRSPVDLRALRFSRFAEGDIKLPQSL